MAEVDLMSGNSSSEYDLDKIRASLVRQEDTIIFSLIERAKYPLNAPLYKHNPGLLPGFSGPLIQSILKETEAIQAKAGRYENPEENPFFPECLPPPLVPKYHYRQILHPGGASVSINKNIMDLYFNELLPLFVAPGDDGNYAATAASDLICLQALSRRIHYGKFVAEVKFVDSPKDYEPPIRAKDKDALMKLLTFKKVEDQVVKRVQKKAMVFGQDVTLDGNNGQSGKYKVDPSFVSRLYEEWVILLTKDVEVEYLLRRLS